jgi:ABC-type branched-subunit amino acid transport system ATPase component/ABC-type branched-subunit amino acid transport system permease subunit
VLNVISSGIVTGLLYALVGLGLVVVYRTSKVLNFGLGGMGVVVAYAAAGMLDAGLPYWVVLPVAITLGAVLGGVIELLIARPLRNQPPLTIALATLGALLMFQGIITWIYSAQARSLPPVLASAGTVRIGDFAITANQLFIIAVSVASTILLVVIIQRSRLGLSMRATSSGPMTSELLGVNVSRVRLSAWMLGGAYGCLAALLVTPLTYLSPTNFTTFLLTAFAAVVLGGFSSIVGVVIGAVLFGVVINLLVIYFDSGLLATYTFIGVALLLVFRPNGLFGRKEKEIQEPHVGGRRTTAARKAVVTPAPGSSASIRDVGLSRGVRAVRNLRGSIGWVILAVLFAVVPFALTASNIFLIATILATFIGVLGLNVVTGFSGQHSLGNSGFVAVGAYTAALSVSNGVPVVGALLLSLLAGAVAGFLIGMPASRLSGIYLVLLTLMFAFAVPELALHFEGITGGSSGLPIVAKGFTSAASQYWLVYVCAAIAAVVILVCASTRLGRSWRAVRDSEAGAKALGLNPTAVKLGAFSISSALVSLSGALTGLLIGYVSPESFAVFLSVYALLAVVLGGTGSVFGSLIGAAFIVWVPQRTGGSIPTEVIFGAALIVVLLVAPTGVVPLLRRLVSAVITRFKGKTVTVLTADNDAGSLHPEENLTASPVTVVGRNSAELNAISSAILEVKNVSTGYGAGTVLHDLSLEVHAGEVVTLLGANGAGKSTVLRTISGLLPAATGEVRWMGETVGFGGLRTPHQIARLGLAHVPEGRGVFPDLTVDENLRMGLFSRPTAGERPQEEREQVLALFPILAERLNQAAGTLSGGEQQMLAIGRALIGRPKLLMLDEPSLGLAPVVSQMLFEKLREIAATGVAVLLIEQNARAALHLADRGYVIRRGRVVIQGNAKDLQQDEGLSETYLEVKS